MPDPSRTPFLVVRKKRKWLFLVRRTHIPCKFGRISLVDGETLLYRRPTVDDAQAHRPYEMLLCRGSFAARQQGFGCGLTGRMCINKRAVGSGKYQGE
jgi:hypothetical protein